MLVYKIIFLVFFSFFSSTLQALGNQELLPVDQAFAFTAKAVSADRIELNWQIADGYYLYRNKTAINSQNTEIVLGSADMPAGKSKHDEFFGDVVIYRQQLKVTVPYNNPAGLKTAEFLIKYQGCADIGICYPPQKKTIRLNLPATPTSPAKTDSDPFTQLIDGFKGLKLNLFEDKLLPEDQAFQFSARVKDGHTLALNWQIADGYYLYKEKFAVSIEDHPSVSAGTVQFPPGQPYHDEAFGNVEIFYHQVDIDLPLIRQHKTAQEITLQVKFQGCADRGVCYPPMQKKLRLSLPAVQQLKTTTSTKVSEPAVKAISEQQQIYQSLQNDSFFLTLLSFFGFGLLLAFTPCIFPMIPILSGIIVGQGESVGTRKAFMLSLSYVLASALTYTVFGILAALFGSNLQTAFQEPWIIAVFSGIFIALSFSMFGFFELQLPKSFQTRLHHSSDNHRDGSYIGAAIMGALSSLIVGPCVAAPLAGALIYIGQTGDVILGGSALFMMGLAMGSPLLLLGASAGKLLPKAGHWMNSTKAIFGVIMLAVALWMLDRILPAPLVMFLSACLLIIPAIYLRAIEPLPEIVSGWHTLWKGLGMVMLSYGILILIGLSMGNFNPLQPLQGLRINNNGQQQQSIQFKHIQTAAELEQQIQTASARQQWLMLDFYADWCISCKEMEAYTLSDSKVKNKLKDFVLVQLDVTENNAEHQAILKRFGLIGPPAILFFGPDQRERDHLRVIGFQNTDNFLNTLAQLN